MHSQKTVILFLTLFCLFTLAFAARAQASSDPRNIKNGWTIPDEGYCDQPYIVVTDSGDWLCVLTTGAGEEGDRRQHVVSTISSDQGRTWSSFVEIEQQGPPEASWVMPLKIPSGRIYAFYVYNGDDIHIVDGKERRVDMLGHYVFKYSDDGGKSWSKKRFRIPLRITEIDRENNWGGSVQMFWGVGKPMIDGSDVFFGFAKIGKWLVERTEGWFLYSPNILHEKDPTKLVWELLPEGDIGLRAPKGPVAEEHNLVALSDGSLYCTYRTVDGYLCAGTSRDRGSTWETGYAKYSPDGRLIKNPRSPAFVRKFSNDKYLLLFHNHGGKDFMGRNPYWLCGGNEKDGTIFWSEPEICLFDDTPEVRIGYPDYIEDRGRYFLTETQKTIARVHEFDTSLLEDVWNQHNRKTVTKSGFVVEVNAKQISPTLDMPKLPNLAEGGGFSISLWLRLNSMAGEQIVLDTRDSSGKGIVLKTAGEKNISLKLSDGKHQDYWTSDPGLLKENTWHHIAAIVDGSANIITYVIDGKLCDGGTARQYGWHRFNAELGDVNGKAIASIAGSTLDGEIGQLRIYDRYLRTSEAIGNYRADKAQHKY